MKRPLILFLGTLICLMFNPLSVASNAQQASFDHHFFKHIPIMHEGRIKPLDSFARLFLQRLSGQQTLNKTSAIQWLSQMLFDPSLMINTELFLVTSQHILQTLKLSSHPSKHYSYQELTPLLEKHAALIRSLENKEEKQRSTPEKDLLTLAHNLSYFSQIIGGLSMFFPITLPVSESLKKELKIEGSNPLALHQLAKNQPHLIRQIELTIRTKGKNLSTYTEIELQRAQLAFQMKALNMLGENNTLLRIMPPLGKEGASTENIQEWSSPWVFMKNPSENISSNKLFPGWQSLSQAYQENNAALWLEASQKLLSETLTLTQIPQWKLSLEVFLNAFHLLFLIMAGYALTLLCLCVRHFSSHAISEKFAYVSLSLSAFLHTSLISTRVLILERPPVSNLYESILFVSLIIVLASLWFYRKKQHAEGLLIGSLLGLFLLGVSHAHTGIEDAMGVLIAVLDTNFWLGTHVICITIGYGCCLVMATLAHVTLVQALINKQPVRAQRFYTLLQTAALISLFFTALGTILGGIWADQSWGRFWGWDPKENGALLIVLWLIWLLHGKITGHIRAAGFVSLLAGTNIIVALSWFGVNLLSVGLHSYGFTDKAGLGLAEFCLSELLLISVLYGALSNKKLT